MSPFDRAFAHVIGHEGGFTRDESDPGNWTGGRVGAGRLRGTKWGISAAAYPQLDIEKLTLEDAKTIYLRDYWQRAKCDELPEAVALCVFDAAVNHGPLQAVKLLQAAVGAATDGYIGPDTLRRVRSLSERTVIEWFQAERILFYTRLDHFRRFGRGWVRRAISTSIEALT